MQYEVRSIGFLSAFKILFVVNLVLGFVMGIFYAIMLSAILSIGAGAPLAAYEFGLPSDIPIAMFFIVLPFMFALGGAVIGTIIGLVAVVIYNIVARLIGGLEFDLRASEEEVAPPSYPTGRMYAQQPPADQRRSTPPPPPPVTGTTAPPPDSGETAPQAPPPTGEDAEWASHLPPKPIHPIDTPQATPGIPPGDLPPEHENEDRDKSDSNGQSENDNQKDTRD